VKLYRRIGLLKGDCVATCGSKFKAASPRAQNFTKGKITRAVKHPGTASKGMSVKADVQYNAERVV
jgi:hypothetical protein